MQVMHLTWLASLSFSTTWMQVGHIVNVEGEREGERGYKVPVTGVMTWKEISQQTTD